MQLSAASHSALAARHETPDALNPSTGHALELPVQLSARSHAPEAARHSVPAAASPSAGQAVLVPVHISATSQLPLAERQTVLLEAKASAGQAREVPSQLSGASHAPDEGRHVDPEAAALQVPTFPARLHASHAPALQAVSQQTPSAQKPELHSVAAAQVVPLASRGWDTVTVAVPVPCMSPEVEPFPFTALPSAVKV